MKPLFLFQHSRGPSRFLNPLLALACFALSPIALAVSPPPDGGLCTLRASVRYDQVNAMLLNEFLKEHRKVEEQADTIADLKSTVAQQRERFQSKLAEQENQIEALASGLQEVRVQIEATKTEPQVAANRP
jgi:septal ring factor EnvC (AmiA/AmiB activator)